MYIYARVQQTGLSTTKMAFVSGLAEGSRILAENHAFLVVHFLLVGMMMREDFPDVAGDV